MEHIKGLLRILIPPFPGSNPCAPASQSLFYKTLSNEGWKSPRGGPYSWFARRSLRLGFGGGRQFGAELDQRGPRAAPRGRDSSRDAGTSSAHHDDVEGVPPAHRSVLLLTGALVSAADRPGALRAWGDSDKLHPSASATRLKSFDAFSDSQKRPRCSAGDIL